MSEKENQELNAFNTGETLEIDSNPDTQQPAKTGGKAKSKWLKPVLLGVGGVAVVAVIATAVALSLRASLSPDSYDTKESTFVTDSDSLSVDSISNDVIATGTLYGDCPVYAEPADGSTVVASIIGGSDVLIYDVVDDYYQITDPEKKVKGFVPKSEVNTFGITVIPRGSYSVVTVDDPAETTTTKATKSTKKSTKKTTKKTTTTTASTATTVKKTGIDPADFPVNSSPYFIYVEKGSHTITIFTKDSNGKYTVPSATYSTAVGRTSSLTPVGDYSLLAKEAWHAWNGGASYSPYCTKYYGSLYFHGPLYKTKGDYQSLYNNSVTGIGSDVTSGCMRTSLAAAYAVYKCPVGTNVKIVNGSPLGRSASRPTADSQRIDPALKPVPIENISLDKTELTLEAKKSATVNVVFDPITATNTNCTWSANEQNIVSLEALSGGKSCIITAKKTGTVTVTVTSDDGGYKATVRVTVKGDETTTTTQTAETTVSSETTASTDPTTATTATSTSETSESSETSETSATSETDNTTEETEPSTPSSEDPSDSSGDNS